MIWVLSLQPVGLDHRVDWYFDIAEEARAAHKAALDAGCRVVSFREDHLSDSHEVSNWLIGEA